MRKLIESLMNKCLLKRVAEDRADDILQPHSEEKIQAIHKRLFGEAFSEDAKQRALRQMMNDDFLRQMFQSAIGVGEDDAFRDMLEEIIRQSQGRFSDAMEQDDMYDEMQDAIQDEEYKFEERVIESYLALISKQLEKIKDFDTGELF